MWRKQDEPKPSSPAPDVVVPPDRLRATEVPVIESRPPAGSLTPTIRIKGEITGHEDLLVEGEVQGRIEISDGSVIVGEKGRVTADIKAREIIVRGQLKGSLYGCERVQIAATGRVTGDVVAQRIAIEEGAVFRGKIEVGEIEEARVAVSAAAASGG